MILWLTTYTQSNSLPILDESLPHCPTSDGWLIPGITSHEDCLIHPAVNVNFKSLNWSYLACTYHGPGPRPCLFGNTNPNIWVNCNDLTATSLESWLIREIIPKLPNNSGLWNIKRITQKSDWKHGKKPPSFWTPTIGRAIDWKMLVKRGVSFFLNKALFQEDSHRIHGAGIYANMTGVYSWDPCHHI